MKKIDQDLVRMILQRRNLDTRQVASIMLEIEEEARIQNETTDKEPPIKKQFCILVSDPQGILVNVDLAGWVVQIPEEESPHTVVDRLSSSAHSYNVTPRGRRYPVKNVAESCEVVSAKIHKGNKIWVKTREPVLVIRTDRKLR